VNCRGIQIRGLRQTQAKLRNVSVAPEKGRGTTGAGRPSGPARRNLQPWQVGSVPGPSSPSAKSVTVVQNARRPISSARESESGEYRCSVFFGSSQRKGAVPSGGGEGEPQDGGGGILSFETTIRRGVTLQIEKARNGALAPHARELGGGWGVRSDRMGATGGYRPSDRTGGRDSPGGAVVVAAAGWWR
jgi:hypothetical protein